MLHSVTRSPFQSQSLAQCLQFICPGDEILLLEDAVIVALSENIYFDLIKNIGVKIYLLEADIIARGLQGKCNKYFHLVDYKGFVLLTEQHAQHMKWA